MTVLPCVAWSPSVNSPVYLLTATPPPPKVGAAISEFS